MLCKPAPEWEMCVSVCGFPIQINRCQLPSVENRGRLCSPIAHSRWPQLWHTGWTTHLTDLPNALCSSNLPLSISPSPLPSVSPHRVLFPSMRGYSAVYLWSSCSSWNVPCLIWMTLKKTPRSAMAARARLTSCNLSQLAFPSCRCHFPCSIVFLRRGQARPLHHAANWSNPCVSTDYLFKRVTLHRRSWRKLWFLHDGRKHSKKTWTELLLFFSIQKNIHVRDTQRTRNLRLLRSDVHCWSRARGSLSVCLSVCVSHFLTRGGGGGNNDHKTKPSRQPRQDTHTHTLLREVRQRQAVTWCCFF